MAPCLAYLTPARAALIFDVYLKLSIMRIIVALLSVVLLGCNSEEAPAEAPTEVPDGPNIIFLLTDDQRQDMLGFAGNTVIQTPNIDWLARNGAYFNNSFVTTAICSVSRASILSGQYGRRHKLWWFGRQFNEERFAQTYPMVLRRAGYRVGFIGKYGVESENPEAHFDYWAGFPGQGQYVQQDEQGHYLHLTRKVGGQMTEFLDKFGTGERPFALSVSFKAGHVQDNSPPRELFPYDSAYAKLYEDVKWQRPPQAALFDHFDAEFTDNNVARNRWEARFGDDEIYQHSLKGYYRLIHGVDVVVGELLEELRRRGLADNTVIVFASDNGFYLGEYGFAGKWYGHEPSIRVPLIVYDPRPGGARGVRLDQIALNIDLAPTLLDFAGLSAPDSMQGRSLLPLLGGQEPDWRQDFLYEHLVPGPEEVPYYIPSTEGVVSLDEKYLDYFVGWQGGNSLTEEVYDLRSDPLEMNNLAEKQPERRDRLRKRMEILRAGAE